MEDNPIILAIIVFFGIFLMFFFISLLSDLIIVTLTLGSAAAAYFIPEWYPIFYDMIKDSNLINLLNLATPENLDLASKRTLAALLIFSATLIAIPVLPFSGTYRQILGANRIGRKDEAYISSVIAKQIKQHNKAHKPTNNSPS